MTTGPRPTPYPIVLHVNETGTPVKLAESSSAYIPSLSAVTISATTYLGLEGGGGVPGGQVNQIQYKTGNTTFGGSPFLRFSSSLSGILANFLSSTSLAANTISATSYINLPVSSLSSLADVQYTSVSGGQALIYSSALNKWAPGYTIYRSDNAPTNLLGANGDIYFRYIEDTTNAAYLSSLLDTNINLVTNGQSLVWNSGYWVPSSIPVGATGQITNIPSSSPIWNAASAEGYDIQWGLFENLQPTAFDVLGFSYYENPPKITNYRVSAAGPLLVQQAELNNLKDLDVGPAQTNDLLVKRSDGAWIGSSVIYPRTISATNWFGLPSSVSIWNANKINNISTKFTDPEKYDLLAFDILGTSISNVPLSEISPFILAGATLSSLGDVDDVSPSVNNTLTYLNGFWTPTSSLRLSSLSSTTISATNWQGIAFGDALTFQFKSQAGGFSSVPSIYYSTNGNFVASNVFISNGGTINSPFITIRNGADVSGTVKIQTVSATTYKLFGKDTSSANTVTTPSNNNQTIVYDLPSQQWRPGYAIYQATGVPNPSLGQNGDIYFQYTP